MLCSGKGFHYQQDYRKYPPLPTHTHTHSNTHSVGAVGQLQSPAAVVVYETVGDVVGASTTGPHTIKNVAYAVSDTPSTTPNPAYGHLSQDKK